MKFKKIVITVTFAAITGREGLLIRDYRKKIQKKTQFLT